MTGYSIFADTIVDMTYPEVEAAAKRGAVALLPMGVVEEHGPHLPAGVDVYGSYTLARLLRQELAAQGVEAVVAPPFYWGINGVTAGWPATFRVRTEVAAGLLTDMINTLVEDGFENVFLVNHQGDAAHARMVLQVLGDQHEAGHTGVSWVEDEPTMKRHGGSADEPHWTMYSLPTEASALKTSGKLGVHAHEVETAMMVRWFPELVNYEALRGLEPTDLTPDDLTEWRKGGEHMRRVTPQGYFGDPRPADPDLWRIYQYRAMGMAAAVRQRIGR